MHAHQPAKAREALRALLKLAPEDAGAKALLESLKTPESQKHERTCDARAT